MNVQVIMRNGEAEYAVLTWADYQALLAAAGAKDTQPVNPSTPSVSEAAPVSWKMLRESRGLPLEAVAREVGISPAYLDMIERGERDPSEAILHGLRRALGSNSEPVL